MKNLNKFQFGGIFASNYTNPLLVNYAEQFQANTLPLLNLALFLTGIATANSSDPLIALRGLNMVKESLNGSNNAQVAANTPLNWEGAFSVLGSKLAQSLPGKAGVIGLTAANAGSNIYKAALNLSDLKGKTGVGKLKAGNIGSIVGSASDLVSSFLPDKTEYLGAHGDITQGLDATYNSIADAASLLGPVGMAVGGAMKGWAALGKGVNALGGGTDAMTKADAILGSSFLSLTPLGLINGFGGKTTNTITKDDEAFEQVGSSYTGSNLTVDEALLKSGKKYGLFSLGARNRANDEIAEAQNLQWLISNIADDATTRFAIRNSMSAINGNRRAFNMQGGYNQANVQVGKEGIKLNPSKDVFREVLEQSIALYRNGGNLISETDIEITIPETIPEFLKGGSVNVIPDGSLHARKHNMEIDGITKKGIPVVDNDGELQAEIEKEEIIFRLDVTLKLEEMEKEYYKEDTSNAKKEELALEAGKLLVQEILHNTLDNTNTILNGEESLSH